MAGHKEDRAVYSIGAVARMLDVPASTLRAWEERYSIVTPSRSGGAQRLYSRAQVEQLRYIKSQMESGASAADAHRLLAQDLAAARVPAAPPEPLSETRPLILIVDRDPYAADLAEYFLRTEGYDVAIAKDAVQARLHFLERSPIRLCAEFAARGSASVLAVAAIESADEALHLGAAAFLPKPLEPLALVSSVRDLLGTSALTHQSRRSSLTR